MLAPSLRTFGFLAILSCSPFVAGCEGKSPNGDSSSPDSGSEDGPDSPNETGLKPFVPAACIPGQSFSTARTGSACAAPKPMKTGMGGNGHSETWDGRVFMITKNTSAGGAVGWVIRVLRPERVQKDADGALDFSNQAFSDEIIVEYDGQNGAGSHNAHAIVRAPGLAENPYRSNEAGVAQPGGEYLSYEVLIYAQNYEQESKLQVRRARFVIAQPNSPDAHPYSSTLLDDFVLVQNTEGQHLRAIEPTLSFDGRLLIAQGHPSNDGRIDNLVYSYNATPGALTGWSPYRYISDLYHVDRDTVVDGIPLHERFPIAEKPLVDAFGTAFAAGEAFPGAYPWISHDGTELVYMATVAGDNDRRPGERARRGGASVIGRFTNWGTRHIDGPINPSRHGYTVNSTVRLFFSSPGAFGTMWTPFRELAVSPFPYNARGPAYPLFGSNTGDYNELSFEDFLDGNYALALRMNESVDRQGNVDPTHTSDTSGHFQRARLDGAEFPWEYNAVDENVGQNGQAAYFTEAAAVRVEPAAALDAVRQAMTVEISVRRLRDMAQDDADRALDLVHRPGSYRLVLEESGLVSAHVWVAGEERILSGIGPALALGSYGRVAVVYDGTSGELRAYRDGVRVAQQAGAPGQLDAGTGELVVGPGGQRPNSPFVPADQPVLILDELRISDVARQDEELAFAAHACGAAASAGAHPDFATLPLGLRAADLRVPAGTKNDAAIRQLGQQLFFDARLSGSGEMSCATCHMPEQALGDGLATAAGNGLFLARNTMPLFNRAFSTAQFWDGRVGSLEAQSVVPLENPEEMDMPVDEAIALLASIPGYAEEFQAVFGRAPDVGGFEAALAAFQRSLLSGNSKVDRFEAGDASALSESEQRGRRVFAIEGRCLGCHSGSNYTDEAFHNNGAVCVGDVGRSAITGRSRDLGLFKTPSLRNVAQSAPYMHDGSLATLEDVVAAYDQGGLHHNNQDAEIHPLGLTAEQKADLVAYLRALDGDQPAVVPPTLP
ncbi:MAG TPA: cytochrome c peroxidase [Polyangiaceae bacterium]|nr:cytochrome c peroxidase [Polyangiaceae bacterium]